MNTCETTQKRLYQYLDGELGMQENREVEEHLLRCPHCNAILQEQRRFLTVLGSGALRDKAPAALRARVVSRLERQRKPRFFLLRPAMSWRLAGCTALALMAAVLLAVRFLPGKSGTPPFIQALARNHQAFLQGGQGLSLTSSDPGDVARWVEQQLGQAPKFPRFDDSNVVLLGARIGRYQELPVAYVSYEVHKVPVTLVVVKKTPETDIETAQHTHVEDRRINFAQAQGLNVVSWSVCDSNFALVSHLPRKGKQGCAVCHANGSGLMDLSEFYTRT